MQVTCFLTNEMISIDEKLYAGWGHLYGWSHSFISTGSAAHTIAVLQKQDRTVAVRETMFDRW